MRFKSYSKQEEYKKKISLFLTQTYDMASGYLEYAAQFTAGKKKSWKQHPFIHFPNHLSYGFGGWMASWEQHDDD